MQFLTSPKEKRYAIVFIDYIMKWVEIFPSPNKSALTIARLLIENIISRHGLPKQLLSGSFSVQVTQEVYK